MDTQTIINIITALLTLLGVGIGIGQYRNKVLTNSKNIEEDKNNIKNITEKHHTFEKDIYYKIACIETNIDNIKTNIAGLTTTQSPLSLSEKGERISNNLEAVSIINRIYDEIIADVIDDQDHIPSPYDIQEKAMKTIRGKLLTTINEEEKERFKAVAFGEGLTIEDLLPLIGIVFRDVIFSKYNIDISQLS